MAQAAGGASEALGNLRREIEGGLRGNAFYMAEQGLRELAELLGVSAGAASAPDGRSKGVPAALAEARGTVDKTLTGNRYYMASNLIDRIGFIAAGAKPAPASSAAARSLNGVKGRSFDGLAAESRARLQEVAQSLGVPLAGQPARRPEAETDGELERRKAPDPGRMDTLEAASLSASAVPTAGIIEAAPDLGSPHAASGAQRAAQPQPRGPAAEKGAAAQAPRSAAPAHDPASAATGQKVTAGAEPAKRKKSIFMLWLDILFGPKRG
jgi:hypothetical protein